MVMSIWKAAGNFFWAFAPVGLLIVGLVQALGMTIANAVAHGDGGFKKYFALSLNVAIVGFGLNSLVVGIIVLVRGPDSFETPTAIQAVIPSLAMLVPGAHGGLARFLGAFNVFTSK